MKFNQWLAVSLPIFIATGSAAETVSDDRQPHTFSTLNTNGSSAAVTSFGNSSTSVSLPTGYVNLSGEVEECGACEGREEYDDDEEEENCTDSCEEEEEEEEEEEGDDCSGDCDRGCCKCTIIVKPYAGCAEASACDEERSCLSTPCSATSGSSGWHGCNTSWINGTTVRNVTTVSATDVTPTELATTVTATYTLSTISATFTSTVTSPTNTWAVEATTTATSTVSGIDSEYITTTTAISTLDGLTTTATSSVEGTSGVEFSEALTTTTATFTLDTLTITATSLEDATATAFSTEESSNFVTVTTATLQETPITETETVTATSTFEGLTTTVTTTERVSLSASSTLTNVVTSTVWSSDAGMSTLEPISSVESEMVTTVVTSAISALPTDYYGVGSDEGLDSTGASLKPYITNTFDLDDIFEEKKQHSFTSAVSSSIESSNGFVSITPYLPDGIVIATTTVTASKPIETSSSVDEEEASNTSIWGTNTPTSVPTAPSFFPSTTRDQPITTVYSTVYVTKTLTHKPSVSGGFDRNLIIVDNTDNTPKKFKTEVVLRTLTQTADVWLSPTSNVGFNSTKPASAGLNQTAVANSTQPTFSATQNVTVSKATLRIDTSTSALKSTMQTSTASVIVPTLSMHNKSSVSLSTVESTFSKETLIPTASSISSVVSFEPTPSVHDTTYSTTVGILTSSNRNLNIFDPVYTTSEASFSALPTTPLPSNPLSSVTVNIEINRSHSDDVSEAASSGGRIEAVEDGVIMDGIVYSPYNNDRTCKRYRTVRDDLSLIKSKSVRSVRVYANDCNSLYTVLPAAKELGLKVNQGLWVTSNINMVDSQVDDIIAAGNRYGWDLFTMFIVGNEVVLMNQVSAPVLAAKMNEIRARLRAAGFNGPITTAEPPSSFLQHPELCDAMDIVAVNAHPYFNAGCSADTSGSFVQGQADVSKQACPNKEVYIAETGYPSQGAPNGGNFPSVENQRIAINDIMIAMDGKATFLSTFDDYWKDPGPHNIEQHFGIIEML